MGLESQGMLLMAEDRGRLVPVHTENRVASSDRAWFLVDHAQTGPKPESCGCADAAQGVSFTAMLHLR